MKRKLMIGAVSAVVILGGAIAAGAAKNDLPKVELESNNNSQKIISHDEAIKLALAKAEGHVESVELEKKNGKSYFEVEIENKDKEVEIRIDAKTGEVLSVKEELDDDDNDENKNKTQASEKNYISVQKAIEIAKKEVNGKVIEVNLDDDETQAIYEIELKTSKGEAEIELDAVTGKVLNIENDDQDDNDLDD